MGFSTDTARKAQAKGAQTKHKRVLERAEVEKQFKQKIMEKADWLITQQLLLAAGRTYLYRIDKEKFGKYWKNLPPKLVESQSEIEEYLQVLVDKANGDIEDETDPSASYYFMVTKDPMNQSIDSMLDRGFGKANQGKLEIEHKLPTPIRGKAKEKK